MSAHQTPARPAAAAPTDEGLLTVLYDGGCPLCRREIAHVRGLAESRAGTGQSGGLCFVDVSADPDTPGAGPSVTAAERQALLARFHVQRADGSRLSGAAAFVAMWQRLPGWRWLARAARLPGGLPMLEAAYRVFLRLRPGLQALARRLDRRLDRHTRPDAAAHTPQMVRELRSDHAGETGAVAIYRGIEAVAAWRGQPGLLAMAQRHRATEAEHLRLLCERLPPGQRSRLLGPWRLAGWLTGALPALAGPRAVHATIAAVETFVDQHYQQQIEHLQRQGDPSGLLPLLRRCQADERDHQREAQAAANTDSPPGAAPLPAVLRAWCACVGAGSAIAVALARRL